MHFSRRYMQIVLLFSLFCVLPLSATATSGLEEDMKHSQTTFAVFEKKLEQRVTIENPRQLYSFFVAHIATHFYLPLKLARDKRFPSTFSDYRNALEDALKPRDIDDLPIYWLRAFDHAFVATLDPDDVHNEFTNNFIFKSKPEVRAFIPSTRHEDIEKLDKHIRDSQFPGKELLEYMTTDSYFDNFFMPSYHAALAYLEKYDPFPDTTQVVVERIAHEIWNKTDLAELYERTSSNYSYPNFTRVERHCGLSSTDLRQNPFVKMMQRLLVIIP